MSNIFIERIMVNPELGKCRVSFRSGVNVIWAENTKEAKGGSDFRNSVGKTTFIKLIDYLMGRKQYISNHLSAEGIFCERYVLAEMFLGTEYFTIVRSLTDNEDNKIYVGCVIDDLLSAEDVKGESLNHEKYIEFLTKQIYGESIFLGNRNYLSHRTIMSYLIRDQFYGFAKFDSGMKEEKADQRKKRLEFLLGLINEKRVKLDDELKELCNDQKLLTVRKNTLKNYFEYISDESYSELKKQKKRLEKKLKENQELLKEAEKIKSYIDEQMEANSKETAEILFRIKKCDEERYILNNRLMEYQKAISDIDNENYKIGIMDIGFGIFEKIEFEKCPFYMKNLETGREICEYLENQGNRSEVLQAVGARKKILEIEKKELKDSIRRVNSYIKQFEDDIKLLKKKLDSKKKEMEKLHFDKKEKYEKIKEDNNTLSYQLELLSKDTRNFEYLEKLVEEIKEKNKEIQEKRALLEHLQHNCAVELNKYYSEIIKYITNNERIGAINFQTYEPRILYRNGVQDNGAGMKNASVLAFDIAMLELAVSEQENSPCHPLFLVHDSPRVHDLDLTIYFRLIDYVINMEYKYQSRKFQYIITTLEISEKIYDKQHMYIRLKLDNSGDEGKLYGCTIDID